MNGRSFSKGNATNKIGYKEATKNPLNWFKHMLFLDEKETN